MCSMRGCGTGLCGPLLRASLRAARRCRSSAQMVERARARQCYDELVVEELSAFMRSRPRLFDAIVSADTLVYFGALEEPLSAAHGALKGARRPRLHRRVAPATASQDYRLEAHGRYAHSEQYLRSALRRRRIHRRRRIEARDTPRGKRRGLSAAPWSPRAGRKARPARVTRAATRRVLAGEARPPRRLRAAAGAHTPRRPRRLRTRPRSHPPTSSSPSPAAT